MFTKLYISTINAMHDFAKNRDGVTAIEYAVIAVAVSAAVLAVFQTDGLRDALDGAMTKITGNIEAADVVPAKDD